MCFSSSADAYHILSACSNLSNTMWHLARAFLCFGLRLHSLPTNTKHKSRTQVLHRSSGYTPKISLSGISDRLPFWLISGGFTGRLSDTSCRDLVRCVAEFWPPVLATLYNHASWWTRVSCLAQYTRTFGGAGSTYLNAGAGCDQQLFLSGCALPCSSWLSIVVRGMSLVFERWLGSR